jgi:hypothetical protein
VTDTNAYPPGPLLFLVTRIGSAEHFCGWEQYYVTEYYINLQKLFLIESSL